MRNYAISTIIIGSLGLLTSAAAHGLRHHHVKHIERANYSALAAREAHISHVPARLVMAVIRVESGMNPHAVHAGNFGLMQIRPQTARGMGYRGTARGLLNPATNVRYGAKYLALAWHKSHGNVCRALMGYQSGVYAHRMSRANIRYCHKAHLFMAQR